MVTYIIDMGAHDIPNPVLSEGEVVEVPISRNIRSPLPHRLGQVEGQVFAVAAPRLLTNARARSGLQIPGLAHRRDANVRLVVRQDCGGPEQSTVHAGLMVLVRHVETPDSCVRTNEVVASGLVGVDNNGVALARVHVHTGGGDGVDLDSINFDNFHGVVVDRDKDRG